MRKLLLTITTLLCCLWVFSQEAPTLQCLQLRNQNTRLYISWSSSNDCSQFRKYYFYINNALVDSLSPSEGFTMCNYSSKVINNIPLSTSYSAYVIAVDNNDIHHTSNTLQTINITVTPSTDSSMAYISWESPSSSSLANNWGSTFAIYKKRDFEDDFPNTPFATVPNTQFTYTDTADVCYNYASYQVGITNNFSPSENCIFKTTIGTVLLVDRQAPPTPVLDSVSYTADNRVGLGFHAIDDNMFGYIIYYHNNGWETVDTIYNTTYWIDPNGGDRCYRIAVLDSCMNSSPMTEEEQCDMRIFLNGTDACHHSASLQWSTYANLHNDVQQYEVFISRDNGNSWLSGGTTTGHTLTVNNLELNTNYMAFVRVRNNGNTISASSNRINFSLASDASTDFTYIRSVSVIDNQYIEVNVHTSGDTLPFQSITLQRSDDGVVFSDIATQEYQNVSGYTFTDNSADFQNRLYYYRVHVINACNMPGGESNISHNILLTGEATSAQQNNLQWNNYDSWAGDIDHYTIFRKLETESVFGELPGALMPNNINIYYDDVADLYESGSKFEYYIKAQETINEYGFNDVSYSNRVVLLQSPTTYIPNAFSPLGPVNRVFMPINSFVSTENYSFTIYTRWGDKVFSTKDPYQGWDGYFDGHVGPMGVYMYRITYTLPDGEKYVKTGSVTLVH